MKRKTGFVPKSEWLSGTYARLATLTDILREPEPRFLAGTASERDRLRQTQGLPGETIRILGHEGLHSLVMKFDGVIGWVETSAYRLAPEIGALEIPFPPRDSPEVFFEQWRGTPYLWGGLSKAGIDCSGLTQTYFLAVHGRLIPRNSRAQREAGTPRTLQAARDHHLIFCHRIGKAVHHVGVFLGAQVWHARTDGGVVRQPLAEFTQDYEIEAVIDLLGEPGC